MKSGEDAAVVNACPAVYVPPEFWTGDLITRIVMASVAVALCLCFYYAEPGTTSSFQSESLFARKKQFAGTRLRTPTVA